MSKLAITNFTKRTLYIGRNDFHNGVRIFEKPNEVYESIEVPVDCYIELVLTNIKIAEMGEVKKYLTDRAL